MSTRARKIRRSSISAGGISIRPHPEEPGFAKRRQASRRTPISGLPEIGTINAQVGQARLAWRPMWRHLHAWPWFETRRCATLLTMRQRDLNGEGSRREPLAPALADL